MPPQDEQNLETCVFCKKFWQKGQIRTERRAEDGKTYVMVWVEYSCACPGRLLLKRHSMVECAKSKF